MNATLNALLADAGRQIRDSCGGGRFAVHTFPNGTVRVTVRLDNFTRQHAAIADGLVYARLSAAGIPCNVTVH